MKYKTYLFDFDGTLVDSMPTFVSVMLRILKENNIDYPDDIVKIITPLGYGGTAKYFRKIGVNMPEEELIGLMNTYALKEYAENIQLKPYVYEVLKKLKTEGANLNILTASPHAMLDVCLKRLGVFELFTNVWSCDDFGTTKANPEIYKMAAEKIGAKPEDVLFIDDNLNADKTAVQAGMKVCGVYDESSKDYEEEIRLATDHYIYDFRELFDL